jgi:hypothetical protein
MNSPMLSVPVSSSRRRWSTRLFVVIAGLACSSALFAQVDPNDPAAGGRNRRGQNGQNGGQGGAGGFGGQGGPGGGGRGGNFDPAQMQQQQMDRMREQFEVTDDAEWGLISERITAVNEARQGAAGMGGFGGGGGRGGAGGPGGQGGQRGGGRGGRGGNVEQQALQQAIADKLPDGEIKARLERLRDSRKAAEEKLARAQENLRAVLSVRQEAVAVMTGLLP